MSLSPAFLPVTFDDLPGWRDDAQEEAFAAFRRSAFRVLEKPYRTGGLGIACADFEAAFRQARDLPERIDRPAARDFFERHFAPCFVLPGDRERGFVTGFYEPVAEASPVPTQKFRWPLYARPHDLVDLDDDNRPPGMDPYFAFGRQTENGIVEFFDREEIEKGALAGRGLEIAWLESKVDVFFIHVQGAARLTMPDGSQMRVTYAAKSGHPFSGPGRRLVELGEISPGEVTMQSIRAWLASNPGFVDRLLWQNRSFIFFCERPVEDETLGPVAAAKVPLTPGRSIAMDKNLHCFATPLYIHASTLTAFGSDGFARLMVAQDTGSAIIGQARGDLFAGSGAAAGEIAGVIRHDADFYALVPKALVAS